MTTKVTVANTEAYVTVGFYDNGQPGELFIKIAKSGSTMSGMADALALVVSMALQNDVSWETVSSKWRDTRFEPSDDASSSLIDAIAKAVDRMLSLRGSDPTRGYDHESEESADAAREDQD